MLEIKTTSITLQGTSSVKTENGTEQAVLMNAVINETWNSNVSSTITNQKLYDENKEACRADIDAFTAKVREIEDAGMDSLTA